ncbi:GNAT family N-acetyltransferase [Microterricola viridarii]|uniref:Acetyltransferase n=1 Tax=Microterricola viridarii TaxID=412690 RepID=A0A120I1A5_9MICO|nr:GNAT family N-acetyltransferase [Microterricola viridarii]AMB59508.1 acetyltransferase [Microterricola viridarii]
MHAVSLRRAVPGDAPAVLRLFDEAIAWFVQIGNAGQWGTEPFTGQPQWEQRVSGWCAEPDTWVAVHPDLGVCGALVLGDAVGYVPAATEPELYVRSLIGSRDPRAKGTGRRLLALADERAAARGVSLLRVDCYAGGSGELIRFYESCGYTRAVAFTVGAAPQEWPGQLLTRTLD